MTNPKLVDVVDARYQLLEVLARLPFLKPLVLHNQVEEFAALHELHDEIEILLGLDDFVDLDYVWMVQLLEDFDFTTDALHVFLLFDTGLL